MKILSILTLFLATAIATAADLPKEVLVATDMVAASKFSPWKPAAPTGYAGTYSGDIGGDTGGELVLKITKKGKEEVTYIASGTYKQTTVTLEPSVVTFTQGRFGEPDEKLATVTAGPVTITFVTYGGKQGVVIGGSFIPKT